MPLLHKISVVELVLIHPPYLQDTFSIVGWESHIFCTVQFTFNLNYADRNKIKANSVKMSSSSQ